MMYNDHHHTKIQAYGHSQRQSKMITINYSKGNIVDYSPLLLLGATHYGWCPDLRGKSPSQVKSSHDLTFG
jgi:hypothetical protein